MLYQLLSILKFYLRQALITKVVFDSKGVFIENDGIYILGVYVHLETYKIYDVDIMN